MLCRRSFRSLGGEGAHMLRKHQVVHPVKFLFESTQCGACLKEYFTHGKMKMHVIRSAPCRTYLLSHGGRYHPAPGLGSSEDQQRHIEHDNKLPPLQALGPVLPPPRHRDLSLVHWDIHDAIVESALTLEAEDDFRLAVQEIILATPISWSRCQLTLQELLATIATETEPLGIVSLEHARRCLEQLGVSEAWTFLQEKQTGADRADTLEDLGETLRNFQPPDSPHSQPVPGPRCIGLDAIESCFTPSVVEGA